MNSLAALPRFARLERKHWMAAIAVFLVFGGGKTMAQTAPEMPAEDTIWVASVTRGPSDGAFHRRFDDAEKWAKEFDNPERDAWQKPEEAVEALEGSCRP